MFPEEVRIVAEGGPAYFGHEVAEEEGAKFGLLAEAVGDEVAFVAVVDADGVRALFIHARVHGVDEGLAFVAQEFEVVFRDDGFEDEIAFVSVLLFLRFCDNHGCYRDFPKSINPINRWTSKFLLKIYIAKFAGTNVVLFYNCIYGIYLCTMKAI